MALTFPFEKSASPIFGTIRRPVAKISFFAKNKNRWYETWMIVDTGADYALLPKYFSSRLGVDLSKDCQIFKTFGIGGQEKVYLLKEIRARIGKWERNVPVGFLDQDDIPPLLGRHLFLETFNLFFSLNHYLAFPTRVIHLPFGLLVGW